MSSPFSSKKWIQGIKTISVPVDFDDPPHYKQIEVPREYNSGVTRLGPRSHEALVLNALDRFRKADVVHAPGKAYQRWP